MPKVSSPKHGSAPLSSLTPSAYGLKLEKQGLQFLPIFSLLGEIGENGQKLKGYPF